MTSALSLLFLLLAQAAAPSAEPAPQADASAQSPEPATKPPLTLTEDVVVTASRVDQRVRDIPASVNVITADEIERSSAQSAEDLLRQIPGFGLRQGSARAIHPSNRSASLRGLGGTSISRTLVLVDGVPMNEPIAGAVFWTRIPVENIERVEVVRSGASGVWGNMALGGVIHIITRPMPSSGLDVSVTADGGSHGTGHVHAAVAGGRGPLSLRVSSRYFTTGGHYDTRAGQRGSVDRRVEGDIGSADVKVEYRRSPDATWTAGGSVYSENVLLGTALADQHMEQQQGRIGANFSGGRAGQWQVLGVLTRQRTENVQPSVAPDRNSEIPATHQFHVPALTVAASVQWSRPLTSRVLLTAGSDLQRSEAESNDRFAFSAGRFTRQRRIGGEQIFGGAYVQTLVHASDRWTIVTAARLDRWQTRNGLRREFDIATGAVFRDDRFGDHTFWTLSPNAGVVHRASAKALWKASVYRGFRAPVTIELYRPIRASGNTIIEPNPFLDPERVTGAEAGIEVTPVPRVRARLTGFVAHLDDPITSVTVELAGGTGRTIAPCGFVPAGGTCRQYQNLGRIRSAGVESEVSYRGGARWTASLSHAFNPTRITRAPAQAHLVGNRGRGVPLHEVVAGFSYDDPRTIGVTLAARYVGERYLDDLNRLRLDGTFVADARIGRRISRSAEAFLRVQNLFDRLYAISTNESGVDVIAPPRQVNAGVRVTF